MTSQAWVVYVAIAAVGFSGVIIALAVIAWAARIVERAHQDRHAARRCERRRPFPFGNEPAGRGR